MQGVVVLFDIDGTLVDCAGAGRRSMRAAFDRAFRAPHALEHIHFGGMTDRGIVREGLVALRQQATDEQIDRLLRFYLDVLEGELAASTSYRVLRGARELVERTRKAGHAVGLGTGNIREGARAKLQRGGLWDLFDFGGFGCDAEARDHLLRRGLERGLEWLAGISRHGSVHEQTARAVVIGDTPRDISAAHGIGAACIAVATGGFDEEALAAASADLVVRDLDDDRILAFIESAGSLGR